MKTFVVSSTDSACSDKHEHESGCLLVTLTRGTLVDMSSLHMATRPRALRPLWVELMLLEGNRAVDIQS